MKVVQKIIFSKSIEFLKDKKLAQVRNLNEFLLENDDTPLNNTDINDFIYIVSILEDIITKRQNYHTFFNFVQKIMKKFNKHEKSIINYIEKYNQIKTLFSKYLNHTESCIKKIKNILNESNFK